MAKNIYYTLLLESTVMRKVREHQDSFNVGIKIGSVIIDIRRCTNVQINYKTVTQKQGL